MQLLLASEAPLTFARSLTVAADATEQTRKPAWREATPGRMSSFASAAVVPLLTLTNFAKNARSAPRRG